MASPLQTAKRSVDLAAGGARGSRIRRDPPRPEKKVVEVDPEERDARIVVIGVVAFALAIAVIVIGLSNLASDRAPKEYTVHLNL